MPLLDIKDAGILAGFTRWGWPWHGVIAGGEVGSTGQPHAQPAINESYLIDMGLPALDISPELAASEAAQGREWRNYALLPRGSVYNRDIGASSFIHIDTAGKPWRIDLTFSFPAAQTLRITADITEFGVLQTQGTVAVTIQKTVDVVCAEIELVNAVDTYVSRYAQIEDVWTNGSQALVGVILVKDNTFHDLFSVVTLTLSGEGGATGAGLVLAAVESIAQPGLTTGTSLPQEFTYSTTFTAGVECTYNCDYWAAVSNGFCVDAPAGEFTAEFNVVFGHPDPMLVGLVTHLHSTAARYAYFSAEGSVKALRLRGGSLETMTLVPTSEWSDLPAPAPTPCDGTGVTSDWIYRDAEYRIVRETGWWLIENDTVIDRLSWVNTEVTYYRYKVRYLDALARDLIDATSVNENQGSLAAYLPASASWLAVGGAIDGAFRSAAPSAYTDSDTYIQDTSIYLGLHRMNSKATAFIVTTPADKVYGLAVTALGALSVGMTPAESTQFAWQRKTGEHTFASNPICYV